MVWSGHQLLSDATTLLVDPPHALWALDWVVADNTRAGSTGVLARFYDDSMANTRDQELGLLGLLHVYMELYIFRTCLPCLELGDTLLLGVCDEQQAVTVEKLPRHMNVELMWKRLQHRDEEQWAKGRVLMHMNSHAKLINALNIDLHTTLGIGVHALNDMHSPFRNPVAPLRPTIGPSLKHDRRLFEGRQRQSNIFLLAAMYFSCSWHPQRWNTLRFMTTETWHWEYYVGPPLSATPSVSNLSQTFRFPSLESKGGLGKHGLNVWRPMSVNVALLALTHWTEMHRESVFNVANP